jgi:glycolate oxidase
VVALPETEEQVQAVLRVHRLGVPVVARGAGTGLSGGATAARADGVLLSLAKFNRIVHRCAATHRACAARRAQPGDQRGGGALGLYYAPDPSSQIACTIGGNVAENSGGVHCLKYGLTVHNILRCAAHHRRRAVEVGSDGARTRRGWTCWR